MDLSAVKQPLAQRPDDQPPPVVLPNAKRPFDHQAGAQMASVAGGYLAMVSLLTSGEQLPTAVFAHNDMMALGALDALGEFGMSCPADISVIGYNDSVISSHCRPALTTVHLPAFEVGTVAAGAAVEQMMSSTSSATLHAMVPRLVIRSSTASPLL